ncbi:MAG TPA: NAD(P)/FAD-dependent oxidoreductase, partial [Armatimonadetes bacterium]|nr:NAD(P)/FAD-dependent oxidoreductase [Armatimonadota bacterium]
MAAKTIILGAGPAGLAAVETMRELDGGESSLTLISAEPPYARMILPYFLAGDIPEEQLYLGSDEYFATLGVETIFGQRVTSLQPAEKKVLLDDGTAVEFDQLLLALGSTAQPLDLPGADLRGVVNLWTLDDAHRALVGAPEEAEVVFIGAGFIGLVVLTALAKRGWKLNLVEIAPQVLPRMLDQPAARLVEKWLKQRGVAVFTQTTVTEIGLRADGRKNVRLSDGRDLTADLVIMAAGVRPNLGAVEGSGLQTEWGILINDRCQTNFPYIYAAGDVAQGPDLLTGEPTVHPVHPTAVEQGRVAGANLAGQEVHYPGSLRMNILNVLNLYGASFGQWEDDGREVQVLSNEARPLYRKLVWDADRLVGAI